MVIAIDFDDTIVDTHSTNFISNRYPPPLPGAVEAIRQLHKDGNEIIIHSCNREAWIREWMKHFNVPYHSIWTDKPVAFVYLDNRGLRFESWDKAVKDIKEL